MCIYIPRERERERERGEEREREERAAKTLGGEAKSIAPPPGCISAGSLPVEAMQEAFVRMERVGGRGVGLKMERSGEPGIG